MISENKQYELNREAFYRSQKFMPKICFESITEHYEIIVFYE